MKTERLIELLQEADPTGQEEVCIGNEDIVAVNIMPANAYGALQVLDRKDGEITEAHITGKGNKVLLQTMSIERVVRDNPAIIVHVETGNVTTNEKYRMLIQSWIKEEKKQNINIDKSRKKQNFVPKDHY